MRFLAFVCAQGPACSGEVVTLCVVSGVVVSGVVVCEVVVWEVVVSGVVVVGVVVVGVVVVVVCVGCAGGVGVVAVPAGVVTVTAEDDDAPVASPAPNSSATVIANSVTLAMPPERPTRRLRYLLQRSAISSWPEMRSWPAANGSWCGERQT
jgi:hypothetical protein